MNRDRKYAQDHTFWEKIKYADFWDSDFWEFCKFMFPVVFLIFLIIFLVFGIDAYFTYKTCNAYLVKGIETQWNFWTGCLANHPKFGWIPVEEYFKTFNIYQIAP